MTYAVQAYVLYNEHLLQLLQQKPSCQAAAACLRLYDGLTDIAAHLLVQATMTPDLKQLYLLWSESRQGSSSGGQSNPVQTAVAHTSAAAVYAM